MGHHILTASQQWATRPQDERFTSLQDLLTAAQADRQTCRRALVPVAELRAVADGNRLIIAGTQASAALNNWSYSQLAGIAGAPGGYLRTLPPQLAADCLNIGLQRLTDEAKREKHALLLRNGGPADVPYTARAINSDRYARLWDEAPIQSLIKVQDRHPEWQLPMSWKNVREGAYRGDRDMFVFMTNGGSIIEDPTLMQAWHSGSDQGNGRMYRGIILKNSEVGSASLSVETFLFRFVCGNHIIWHASNHTKKSRRHIGSLNQWTADEMIRAAMGIADASARQDEQQIAAIAKLTYGTDKDACIAQARKDGLTERDARASYDAAEANEPNPRSTWGYVNGITRHSQTYLNQDDRHELDMIAGRILQRARVAVAA